MLTGHDFKDVAPDGVPLRGKPTLVGRQPLKRNGKTANDGFSPEKPEATSARVSADPPTHSNPTTPGNPAFAPFRVSNFEINDGYLFPSLLTRTWFSADRVYPMLVDVPTGEVNDAHTHSNPATPGNPAFAPFRVSNLEISDGYLFPRLSDLLLVLC